MLINHEYFIKYLNNFTHDLKIVNLIGFLIIQL